MKASWLLLVALALLASCKKDRSHTSAEGVVIDATTQARVAGARVYLLQTKGTSLYASPSRVQYVTADNLGKYSLSFEAESDSRYDLQARRPRLLRYARQRIRRPLHGRQKQEKRAHQARSVATGKGSEYDTGTGSL